MWHKPTDGHQYAAPLPVVNRVGRGVWCPGPYEHMSDNPHQGRGEIMQFDVLRAFLISASFF